MKPRKTHLLAERADDDHGNEQRRRATGSSASLKYASIWNGVTRVEAGQPSEQRDGADQSRAGEHAERRIRGG